MVRPPRPLLLLLTVAALAAAVWWWGGATPPPQSAATEPDPAGFGAPAAAAAGPTAEAAADTRRSAAAAADSAFPPREALRGAGFTLRVTDEAGAPLAGARVRCGAPEYGYYGYLDDREWEDSPLPIHAESFTDAEGIARLGGLPLHEQLLVAADAPGRTRTQRLLRTPGEGESVDAGAWPLQEVEPVRLLFVTTDGSPAADVEFYLSLDGERDDLRDLEFSGRTDERGAAILDHVPPLAAAAWVHGRGRFVSESVPALEPAQRAARIVVQSGRAVEGRLLEADGTPVAGARVGLWLAWSDEAKLGMQAMPWGYSHMDWESFRDGVPTSADGSFTCQGLPDDRTTFSLTAFVPPNQLYASRWLARTDPVEFRIPVRHALRGRIAGPFDPAQASVEVRRVRLPRSEKHEDPIAETFTLLDDAVPCAADGSFVLLLPEGPWSLRVHYPGGEEVLEEHIDLAADRDLGLREVGGGGSILLICHDAERLPDPECRIERFEKEEDPWFGEAEEDWQSLRRAAERMGPDGWRFRGLAPGRYRLILDASGCEPAAVEVTLAAREAAERTLTLVPTGSLTVEILDHVGRRATSREVEAVFTAADPPTPREEMLDDLSPWRHPSYELAFALDGLARANDLPAGEYAVRLAHAEGVATGFGEENVEIGRVTIEAGRNASFRYGLDAMGQVQFLVRAEGKPVAGARVAYWTFDDERRLGFGELHDPDSGGVTAADGSFTAEALAPGRYLAGLRVREDEAWTLREFEVAAGTQTVEMEPALGRVRGRVTIPAGGDGAVQVALYSEDVARRTQDLDEHGEPLLIEDLRWYAMTARTTVGDAGTFAFAGVPPGRYRVYAVAEDDAAGWSPWFEVAPDGADADAGEIQLLPHAEIQWAVRGLGAWEEYGPRIEFRPAAGGEIWAREWLWATEEEETVFVTLPIGTWSVELYDFDGRPLGFLTQIAVTAEGVAPPSFTMPAPESVGAKRMEFEED